MFIGLLRIAVRVVGVVSGTRVENRGETWFPSSSSLPQSTSELEHVTNSALELPLCCFFFFVTFLFPISAIYSIDSKVFF